MNRNILVYANTLGISERTTRLSDRLCKTVELFHCKLMMIFGVELNAEVRVGNLLRKQALMSARPPVRPRMEL